MMTKRSFRKHKKLLEKLILIGALVLYGKKARVLKILPEWKMGMEDAARKVLVYLLNIGVDLTKKNLLKHQGHKLLYIHKEVKELHFHNVQNRKTIKKEG